MKKFWSVIFPLLIMAFIAFIFIKMGADDKTAIGWQIAHTPMWMKTLAFVVLVISAVLVSLSATDKISLGSDSWDMAFRIIVSFVGILLFLLLVTNFYSGINPYI